jgi:hypothetical protein
MEKKNAKSVQAGMPQTSNAHSATKIVREFVVEMESADFAVLRGFLLGEAGWKFRLRAALLATKSL